MFKFLTPITFLFLIIVAAAQAAGPTVVLNPSKTSAAVGDTIIVTIDARDFPVSEGGGLNLGFNPSVIQVKKVSINTSAWEFVSRPGRIDNTSGNVSDILFASFKGVQGDALIATVEVQIVGEGNANLTLQQSSLTPFASQGQALSVTLDNGTDISTGGGMPPPEEPPPEEPPEESPAEPPANDPPVNDPPADDPPANDPTVATSIETASATDTTSKSGSNVRLPGVQAFGTTNQSGSSTVTTADGRQYNQAQSGYSDNYTASGNQVYNNPQTQGSNTIAQQNTASGDKQTQLAQNSPFTQGIANPGNRQSPTAASNSMGSDSYETQRRVMPEETSLPWLWLTPLLLLAGYFAVRSFR